MNAETFVCTIHFTWDSTLMFKENDNMRNDWDNETTNKENMVNWVTNIQKHISSLIDDGEKTLDDVK